MGTTKTSSTSHSLNNRRQNAEGSRSHQAHEAQHRAGRHRREEGGVPRRVHQAAVGLHQEAQPAGPREQAVLHPRQEDGKELSLSWRCPARGPELTTEPFSRLRDEPRSRLAFSRGGDFGDPPTSSKCRPPSKYYQ